MMIPVLVILLVIFLLMGALFSGLETGLVSIDKLELEKDSHKDKSKAKILDLTNNPNKLFGLTLSGNNIANVTLSALFARVFVHEIGCLNETESSLILSGIVLIFSEIIPKALYRDFPMRLVTLTYPFINFFSVLFKPFILLVTLYNKLLAKYLKITEKNLDLISREDIHAMFSSSKDNLKLQDKQKEMLEDALEFSESVAKNVMIPRTEVVALESSTPLPEVIAVAKKEGYTRFPVYSENIDNITGILIIYDLLTCKDKENHTAKEFVRESLYVPETMDLDAVLKEMQNQKKSLAVVVDSYGGTAGIVTTEDILEEIVGEIEDEYDSAENTEVQKINENNYIVFGYVDVDTLNDEFDMNLPEGDYETVAGLIIDHLEKIPVKDEKFQIADWNFKIEKVTNRKIEKIRLTRKKH
ncbi:MAG: hypothetical protein CSB55_06265 [Candidatus Cloacimonadota bacterium]|nr:MAG: hypothetical protein CSB55_06265 [Candidatus Cloacimonadota bacterium]